MAEAETVGGRRGGRGYRKGGRGSQGGTGEPNHVCLWVVKSTSPFHQSEIKSLQKNGSL